MNKKNLYHINEDYLIEGVLQRGFLDGKLDDQESKLAFDFQNIATKKRGEIDVEEYKKMFAKQRKRGSKKREKKTRNSF